MNNRTIKSKCALITLLTFALFSIASAQTPAANKQSDVTHRVDQLFARFDRPDSPGCALGVVKDGKLIYKKGYGIANLEHDIPISPSTVFNVAPALKDEFLSGGFNFDFTRDPQNKVNGFLLDTDRSINVRFAKRK